MADLDSVFAQLRIVMEPHVRDLDVKADSESNFYVDTHFTQKNKKPLFFGAVQRKQNYVSYHLMPIYVDPSLLDGISDELRKRMQGKSCFNFKEVDEALFAELGELTAEGLDRYRKEGFV